MNTGPLTIQPRFREKRVMSSEHVEEAQCAQGQRKLPARFVARNIQEGALSNLKRGLTKATT